MQTTRRAPRLAVLLALAIIRPALAPLSAMSQEAPPPPLALEWIGPVDADRTSNEPYGGPNGVNDLALAVAERSMGPGAPVQWTVTVSCGLRGPVHYEWPRTAAAHSPLHVERTGAEYILYMEPFLSIPGDVFTLSIASADGIVRTGRVIGEGIFWGDSAVWGGQSDSDFVGAGAGADGIGGNGLDDWEITVSAPGWQSRTVVEWRVWLDYTGTSDHYHSYWSWRADDLEGRTPGRRLHPVPRGDSARLYLDPVLAREGDQFAVQAVMEDGTSLGWLLAGGGSEWGETALYHGRFDSDRIGAREIRPSGINDIQLEVIDPALSSGSVSRCAVESGGRRWEWPPRDGDSRALIVEERGGGLTLTFEEENDVGGRLIFVSAVVRGGRLLGWAVPASRTNNSSDAVWLGQAADMTGLGENPAPDGEADLAIEVRDPKLALSVARSWRVEGAGRAWGSVDPEDVPDSHVHVAEGSGGDSRTIYFSEAREPVNEPIARGSRFTVTAVFEDGSVVNWRLASPGSPRLGGARWLDPSRNHYLIEVEDPDASISRARVRGGDHVWTTGAADAQVSSSRGTATIRLAKDPANLSPGDRISIEITGSDGVRRYAECFAGATE